MQDSSEMLVQELFPSVTLPAPMKNRRNLQSEPYPSHTFHIKERVFITVAWKYPVTKLLIFCMSWLRFKILPQLLWAEPQTADVMSHHGRNPPLNPFWCFLCLISRHKTTQTHWTVKKALERDNTVKDRGTYWVAAC